MPIVEAILYDPQTSGGLLVAASAGAADQVAAALARPASPPSRIGAAGPRCRAPKSWCDREFGLWRIVFEWYKFGLLVKLFASS